jgi:hypothetical protein
MEFKSISQAKRLTGLSYIGMVNNSAKHEKAYHYNEMVYTIYLAPADTSGFEVCPGRTKECSTACLNMSGRNKMVSDMNHIERSRITKTRLFFEHREFFVKWVSEEIERAQIKARALGYRFSVRLNNTSDISPEDFYMTVLDYKVNLLEWFPEVQFYDYTKVPTRINLLEKYPNYDLTFSYSGRNEIFIRALLKGGFRVAIVFKEVPETFWGYPVVNGNDYDMRYLDPRNIIIGLPYKKVRNQLVSTNTFVIQ